MSVPTIEDVAIRAGVSVATVSRVLNNSHMVSSQKVERVLAAVKELNYQPNALGRSLRRSESKVILVVCPVVNDEVLQGIHDAAKELEYGVIINYVGPKRDLIAPYFENFHFGYVDGAILFGAFYRSMELKKIAEQLPIVQCCGHMDLPNSFRVSIDDEKAAYDMTSHIISTGKKKIGLITLDYKDIDEPVFSKREKGYKQALADNNIPFDPELRKVTFTSFESGYETCNQLLEQNNRPDAIFCVTDMLAFSAIRAIQDAGLSVPRDIAVGGFDNREITEICNPKITTIAQPFYEMGQVAFSMLVSKIKGDITVGRKVMMNHELIIRGSTVEE